MMKNLLLTIFTVLIASASFSQLSIALIAPGPLAGTTTNANSISFTVEITNDGSAAIPAGDTIVYWFTIDGTSMYAYDGRNGVSGLVLSAPLAPGAKTAAITALTGGFTNPPSSPTTTDVCTFAAIGLNLNNTSAGACYTINRSLVSIEEKTISEEVNISAAFGVLKMTSLNKENYTYSVYSITGQVISQGNFVNNTQVDLTGAAKGVYAVVVTNGTEKITKKIAIQ